jgi:glycosyltransferase involved in cell wall biosynthesis
MTSEAQKAILEEGNLHPDCSSSHADSITVVIPAYNEERTIGQIVRIAKQHANDVIVVDDGSDDSTGEFAVDAGAKVIRIPNNSGKGHALGIGLSTAAMNGSSVVVCLDADGQHDPADIPRIVQPIVDGKADMVIGSRFLSLESKNQIPAYRKIGQNILTTATNFGSSVKITDSQSGYRAFTKETARGFSYSETGMGIESEMIRNAVGSGARIQEVSIAAKYQGVSKASTYRPGSHGIAVLGSIIRSVRSEHPLLYFGVAGLSLFILGLVVSLYSVQYYLEHSILPLGPTLLAVATVFLGTLFILVGLILNAISDMASKREKNRIDGR